MLPNLTKLGASSKPGAVQNETPLSLVGTWHGCSLLFPMEKLFERYVEACPRRTLPAGTTLQAAARRHHLARHEGQPWFALVPDFLVTVNGQTVVLDTKWKRIDESRNNPTDKYGLSQADFYQLFAYGTRYLSGAGDMLLVYPRTTTFRAPLPVFEFSETLRLWVVPFDLVAGSFVDEPFGLSSSSVLKNPAIGSS
jgi:5-methylcytosine-specific restriction enzyme subunit McrC